MLPTFSHQAMFIHNKKLHSNSKGKQVTSPNDMWSQCQSLAGHLLWLFSVPPLTASWESIV